MIFKDGIHDDTDAIQAMLDECGIVMLKEPGTYLISRTLIIHSNTRFILSPGAHMLAAPNSRCALIENEHFRGGEKDKNIRVLLLSTGYSSNMHPVVQLSAPSGLRVSHSTEDEK